MVKQELFKGDFYDEGIHGKKLLVVGHQKHATEEERIHYKCNPRAYNISTDNIEMMKELVTGTCMNTWTPRDRKSWLQFGKMLSGNNSFNLGTDESSKLLNSIAFCNYIQIPDIALEKRKGKDAEDLYIFSEKIFKEYLEEFKPDKIIVWGIHAYQYVKKLGNSIDERHCIINLPSYGKIDVLMINHPCIVGKGGYEAIMKELKSFILKD